MQDFDRYCEEHNIGPDEAPAAFAAWLNQQTGWDGTITEVCTECRHDHDAHTVPGVCRPTNSFGDVIVRCRCAAFIGGTKDGNDDER